MKYTIKKRNAFPSIDKVGTGKNIKMYMDHVGLTARELQKYLRLGSVQSIYHWMEGKSLPSVDNLFALSILLGVTLDDLICSEDKMPQIFYDYAGIAQPEMINIERGTY